MYKLIILCYQREIRQNVYPQPNYIRSIFGLYSLPIDSDSVFVSAHYPLRFRIRNKYGNEYGFTTIRPHPLCFHPYRYQTCAHVEEEIYILGATLLERPRGPLFNRHEARDEETLPEPARLPGRVWKDKSYT
jgi:hypothetical protein